LNHNKTLKKNLFKTESMQASKRFFHSILQKNPLFLTLNYNFSENNRLSDIIHKPIRTHEETSYNRVPTGYHD